ncbi:MAG: AAA family ATPase [Dolichospermum sp. DEX189]|jgi:Fe-S cluster assembly ATPase SufC|uniref:AAA family ATPase n=1 Tax=Aphanizomenon flos-aquae FACHB-1040 TaxID=2692887 RepID=A0ABR8C203_APHFL|nr:AAA family ATPase [Aphanizomenon flos-aquae]MBD2280936.1 AAA family ATPase [Aphanizomenon flos-aquae FACHB-1040]MBO1068673.1 AAA family ATPase [Dolichospermum sp. DEX189]
MKLLQVQVPDFRVLKDVDIKFDRRFVPNIFPLGSLNGGGKSTLLQLVFVLLHCCTNPERKVFIKNLLHGFTLNDDSSDRVLAIIKIWDGEKEVEIKFLVCHNTYIENILKQDHKYKNNEDWKLSNFEKLENITKNIYKTEQDIEQLEKAINKLEIHEKLENDDIKHRRFQQVMRELFYNNIISSRIRRLPVADFKEEVEEMLDSYQLNLDELSQEKEKIDIVLQKISTYLHEKNIIYICNYSSGINTEENEFVLCQIGDNLDINKAEAWLDEISNKVFLAAPISQVFLFTHHEYRRRFFEQNSDKNYDSELKMSKLKLPGFFTYDFAQPMITVFTNAINEDYRDAIKTEGEYGKRYKALLDDLNSFLVYKKVNISTDLSTIIFQLDTNDENIKLYPEDLSHGELKRLSIYLWIKYNKIEDAIVLMDEIEIGFHPDWQYEIIRDLEEWSPSNQYILATHSYQLCRALTPAHVRELEPKLIKSDNNIPL